MLNIGFNGYRLFSCISSSKLQLVPRLKKFFPVCGSVKSFYCYEMSSSSKIQNSASSSFKEKLDIYSGVSIDTRDISYSDEEFEVNLKNALKIWQENGVRGVWFRVNISDSSFIPALVKHQFVFHHARDSYAMLTRWLPEGEPNLLPQFPHTHVGVGGMVINDKDEVLVIQERYARKPHWKLPGGYSNPGEDFAITAHREVLEETGVDSEFLSVVSLRHQHQHIFDCSDIYVVCLMKPVSSEIKCNKDEIALCQWMDINTYVNHSSVTDFNKCVMQAYMKSRILKAAIVASPVLSYTKDCYHQFYALDSKDVSAH